MTNLSQNLLQKTKFSLSFDRIANTVFYCTKVAVPGIMLGTATQPTPFVNLKVPGTKVQYEPLTVTFLVDAEMNAWYNIFNWMMGIGRPVSAAQYRELANNAPPLGSGGPPSTGIRPPYSDAQLSIYTAKNNQEIKFAFLDCFPVNLGPVEMDTEVSADAILTVSASFVYSYYTFTNIDNNLTA